MAIERSVRGIVTAMERHSALIKEILALVEGAAGELEQTADRVEVAREETKTLIANLRSEFKVARTRNTKEKQQALLEAISEAQEKVVKYKDDSLRSGIYSAQLSQLYMAFSATYDDTVGTIVNFTDEEVADFNRLLQGAILDAGSRKKRAAIVDSAVKVSSVLIGIGKKIALA